MEEVGSHEKDPCGGKVPLARERLRVMVTTYHLEKLLKSNPITGLALLTFPPIPRALATLRSVCACPRTKEDEVGSGGVEERSRS